MKNQNTRWTLLKYTALIRLYTFLKIPLLWSVRPSLISVDDEKTVLKVPLFRRTQNHLKVMYFGALAMGGEACVAAAAIKAIHDSGKKVDYIFKDFHADFLKRAESDVHFICEQNKAIVELVQKAISSKVRESQKFESYALTPDKTGNEKVASFTVTLSVKYRQR